MEGEGNEIHLFDEAKEEDFSTDSEVMERDLEPFWREVQRFDVLGGGGGGGGVYGSKNNRDHLQAARARVGDIRITRMHATAPSASASAPASASTNWLPEEDFSSTFHHHHHIDNNTTHRWTHLPQSILDSTTTTTTTTNYALPHHPDIRLTTDFSTFPHFQQPQASATSYASSPSSHPPLHETPYSYYYNPAMNSIDDKMQHTPPVSPHSPQPIPPPAAATAPATATGDLQPLSRKRSHSEMSGGPPHPHAHPNGAGAAGYSRAGSVTSLHPDLSGGDDFSSSPRSRTVKRTDPPMNPDNKFICTFSLECDGLTFDRKCEWSKHMDKHDRPYRCAHASCAKLQGFTYSGGLLRHEREVHGKHGGPRAQLMCPYEDCKRHSGKGFTRKENLNEHVRRVHHHDVVVDVPPEEQPPAAKRLAVDVEEDVDDLRQEVFRLRSEVAEKDSRLVQLELALQEFRDPAREM